MSLTNNILKKGGLALFVMLVVLPFMGGFVHALFYSVGLTGLLSTGFSLRPFREVFEDGSVFFSIGYSFYIAMAAMMLTVSSTLFLILAFKDRLLKSKTSYFLYLPLSIPSIAAAFLSFQIFGKSGIFSRIAYHLHVIGNLQNFPDLINDHYAIGIILTHSLMAIPFFLIYFSNVFINEQVNKLEDMAASLGASGWQTARRITIPLMFKKSIPVLLLYFIFISGSYEIPLILGRQSPEMISLLIVRKVQRFNLLDIPQGYAVAIIYMLTVSVLLGIFFSIRKNTRPWQH